MMNAGSTSLDITKVMLLMYKQQCNVDCQFISISILCPDGTRGSKEFAASFVCKCVYQDKAYVEEFMWNLIMSILY
jgi:hypothetical protein